MVVYGYDWAVPHSLCLSGVYTLIRWNMCLTDSAVSGETSNLPYEVHDRLSAPGPSSNVKAIITQPSSPRSGLRKRALL
jgi:hypothetical protein